MNATKKLTDLLTRDEAAALLDVTPQRVSQLVAAGELDFVPVADRRLITRKSVKIRLANPVSIGRPKNTGK